MKARECGWGGEESQQHNFPLSTTRRPPPTTTTTTSTMNDIQTTKCIAYLTKGSIGFQVFFSPFFPLLLIFAHPSFSTPSLFPLFFLSLYLYISLSLSLSQAYTDFFIQAETMCFFLEREHQQKEMGRVIGKLYESAGSVADYLDGITVTLEGKVANMVSYRFL